MFFKSNLNIQLVWITYMHGSIWLECGTGRVVDSIPVWTTYNLQNTHDLLLTVSHLDKRVPKNNIFYSFIITRKCFCVVLALFALLVTKCFQLLYSLVTEWRGDALMLTSTGPSIYILLVLVVYWCSNRKTDWQTADSGVCRLGRAKRDWWSFKGCVQLTMREMEGGENDEGRKGEWRLEGEEGN